MHKNAIFELEKHLKKLHYGDAESNIGDFRIYKPSNIVAFAMDMTFTICDAS